MKGYIYKLTDGDGKTYIGSSINPQSRFNKHKANNSGCHSKNLDLSSITMEILEECESGNDMLILEKKYIQQTDCVNRNIPLLTKSEKLERRKKIRDINKDKYNEDRRVKVECSICNKMISKYNMKRHMEGSAHTKPKPMTTEEIKIKRNMRALEKVECPHCSLSVCKSALNKHIKRKHTNSVSVGV